MVKAIYNFFITLFYIPYLVFVIFRIFIKKEHSSKFKEKVFLQNIKRPDGYLFWFHVASLGELNSVLPIVEFYLKENQKYNVLITTVTLSSYNQFEKIFRNNKRVFHQFLPYDFKPLIKNFISNWRPNIVSFVDSEIWPNFIFEIKKSGIPFILLNARITKKTFDRWMVFKKFAFDTFGSFSLCIASSKDSAGYLELLKVKNIKYFGNIKFCNQINLIKEKNNDQFKLINNKKGWVALSTHKDEEYFCAKVHKSLKKSEKDLITIIIPRHIHRIKKIYKQLLSLNLKVQIKNENEIVDKNADIILVNYYGSISKYLNYYKNIFIGKSLISSLSKVGGQNPIDAVRMGCKVYHGPFVYNFREIYDYLNKNHLAEEISKDKINDPEDLAYKLVKSLKDNPEKNSHKIDEFKIYSKKIFNNVTLEYDKFIK